MRKPAVTEKIMLDGSSSPARDGWHALASIVLMCDWRNG
jgi:hypothetical protein